MKAKCEFCDEEFENLYDYAEHLEYHCFKLMEDLEESKKAVKERKTKSFEDNVVINDEGRRSKAIIEIFEKSPNLSPHEIVDKVKRKMGIDIPVSRVYSWRNYHKKQIRNNNALETTQAEILQ